MALVGSDSRGFTILEFLVAIVIMTVGLLALLQSVNIAITHNMKNQLRSEGTQVADEEMAKEMAKGSTTAGFAAISTGTRVYSVSRVIPTTLNLYKNYSVTKTGSQVSTNTKQITVQVAWRHKAERFTQAATSLLTKMQQ
jgi:type IV pilus assembly protein PilV